MMLFADFINKTAAVVINIYDAATDVRVVTNGACTAINGMHKYNFSARDPKKDYYFTFTNTTNNITIGGSIERDSASASDIRAEMEVAGGKLDEAMKAAKKARIQTL